MTFSFYFASLLDLVTTTAEQEGEEGRGRRAINNDKPFVIYLTCNCAVGRLIKVEFFLCSF